MREVGRVQMGYFPTPDRVTEWIARMLTPKEMVNGAITIVDPCAGEGKAIHDVREIWLKANPNLNVKLLGVENEKNRAAAAATLFNSGKGGGECIWGSMEDCRLSHPHEYMANLVIGASLMWFNPPFDRIRGQGRMEKDLFDKVCEWPTRGGLIVFILPDYVLSDRHAGIAVAIERHYKVLRLCKFPQPEYEDFKQCVVIAQRRPKALGTNMVYHPEWAEDPEKWQVMTYKDAAKQKEIAVNPSAIIPTVSRSRVGVEIVRDFVANSPVRGQLLLDAMAEPPKIGRPPLSLSSGHLAMALAGGLCDGIISNGDDDQFLVKGSLKSAVMKTGRKEKKNRDGEVTADIDIYKTRYSMNVRCLRSDGSIETFTSAEASEELAAAGAVVEEEQDE